MSRVPPSLEPAARSDAPRGLRARPASAQAGPATPKPTSSDMPSRSRPRWLRRIVIALVIASLSLTVLPVLVFSVVPTWTSSFMLRYQAERMSSERKLPALQHDWVSWDEIAPAAKLAVIAAEDQKFPEHFGFDLDAITKAMEYNRNSRRTRGASTLTQQVAKNLFLWPGRSWVRKGLEVGYTLLIETLWSKRRVLEVYLNIAEFGRGVYGVEAAAQKFFGKPATKLTAHEAALLAAVLPSPARLRVDAPSTYVQNRAAWIRGQMNGLGYETLDAL